MNPVPSHSLRHVPVMLPEVLAALQPEAGGVFIDGTFGAGGYTRAILQSSKAEVIAIDRDPAAIAGGQAMTSEFGKRLHLVQGTFSGLKDIAASLGLAKVQGVVLDIGVSSMQLDEADRGFSFLREGPLDMRMAQHGPSAKDVVNTLAAEDLANIIFILGEEPRSRAIARAIVKARTVSPIQTTIDLARAVEQATGPQRATDRTHPATRTFQALRIHVNNELEELALALSAAENILEAGGRLVVVTFHSLEDRIVKRFFALRCGRQAKASRHVMSVEPEIAPSFTQSERGAVLASEVEARQNPRARSAKLRFGIRSHAPSHKYESLALGLPQVELH